jgi:hypothetical protein
MEELAENREAILRSNDVTEVFNYGMAEWGHRNIAPLDLMERTLKFAEADSYRSANRHQCFALAHHVCGKRDAARLEIERARTMNSRLTGREFSCWRYLEVSRNEMRRDLNSLEKFVNGEGPGPAVLRGADNSEPFLH